MPTTRGLEEGVNFPSVDGQRSSQRTARRIFSAAVRNVDADAAERFDRIKEWRKNYIPAVREVIELGARSAKDAGRIASDGLDALRASFVFEREPNTTPLTEIFESESPHRYNTEEVKGEGEGERELTIPYRGEVLRADTLKRELERWVDAGTIEQSTARALRTLVDDPGQLDVSDQTFAILGAASEMGPFPKLSKWGATIHAVDIPEQTIWERIVKVAKHGSGRVLIPADPDAPKSDDVTRRAGLDLIRDLPEAAAWLKESEGLFTLGDYAYSDGAKFARLAVATDTLAEELLDTGHATSYAYLASPTDVFAVSPEVVEGARANRKGIGRKALGYVTARKLYAPSYGRTVRSDDGNEWGIYDCLIKQQGANYSLAKTLQRWRAVATHENRLLVSANVAPATRTRSVVKNKVLASAYAGAGPFGVEIFESETSSALMAAMLVHDLRQGKDDTTQDPHPFKLFVDGAAHGGLWRLPYEPRSILPLAVVLGNTTHRRR